MISVIRIAIAALGLGFCAGFAACTHGTAPNGEEAGGAAGNASSAGSSNAGNSGSGGEVMQVDASTSCSDLFTLARQQLDEATSCIVDAAEPECTGLVDATCGCRVSVDSPTSVATQSYLSTLAVIQQKKCGGACPLMFCEEPGPGNCVPRAGTNGGVCIHRP